VILDQFFNGFINFTFNYLVVLQKSKMNLTSFAAVRSFFKVKVLDPILDIGRSSERNDDLVLAVFVAHIACGESQDVVNVRYLSKVLQVLTSIAIPCF
jgi:hypothetical protein